MEGSARSLTFELDRAAQKTIVDRWEGLSEEERTKAVGMLTVGSNNMDIRGQVMDGEVSMVITGVGAMSAYFNTMYVAGVTTWVESIDELQTMVPRGSVFARWLSRWVKNAL